MGSRELNLLLLFRISRSIAGGMIMLVFPYLVLHQLHWSPLRLGIIYTVGTVATAVFGLFFGTLTDTWGRRPSLLLAGVIFPIGISLVLVSHLFGIVILGAALGGFSATGSLASGGLGGSVQPIQNAWIADLTAPNRRTRIFSVFSFLNGIAGAIGMLIGKFFSVQAVFFVAIVISAVGLLPLLRLHSRVPVAQSAKRLASKVNIGKFSLTGLLNGASQGLITPFLIPFFVIVYHLPRSSMGTYGFYAGVLGALAILLAPWFDRKLGFVGSIAITRGLGAVLIVLMPLVHALPLALFAYLLTPPLRVIAVPVQQSALTGMVAQEEYGRALGINQMARLLASSGATALSGELFDISAIELPFILYGLVMAANIVLYFKLFRNYRPK